jgi:hypothetical protein
MTRLCLHAIGLAGLLAASATAHAQAPAPGEVTTSLALSAPAQLKTDMDGGGNFRWWGVGLNFGITQQFTAAFSAGISVQWATERWSFSQPGALGAVAPWQDIQRPSVGLNFGYSLSEDLSLFVAPQVEWAYEAGARASDGVNYGAVVGVTKVFSPTLVLGLGLGAFRQIDENQYFPFVIVNWQLSDALRLSNPLQAGPAGGAGLELAYALSDDWELAAGGAYRDYRFRLKSDGPVPGGLGQHSGVPVFARLTHKFGPVAQVDLYAGYVLGGRLKVLNQFGTTVRQTDYGASPMLALSGSISF